MAAKSRGPRLALIIYSTDLLTVRQPLYKLRADARPWFEACL